MLISVRSSAALQLFHPIADKLCDAGARHVVVLEHWERLTAGNWLSAEVVWRHQHHRLSTDRLCYESWTENCFAMASRLYVLAAQLRTKA